MARPRNPLPLLAHLPRLESDGVTHRRDCECVRCDAGFRPTEHDRTMARERAQLVKTQQAAAKALDRRREKVRAKKFALVLELEAETRVTDERIGALREARTRIVRFSATGEVPWAFKVTAKSSARLTSAGAAG